MSNQGQIKLSASLNHEEMPSYTLTLSVRDSKDGIGNPDSVTDDSVTVNVTVNDVDEPPGVPTGLSVSTNDDNPTTALDVSWTAPDTTGIPEITGYDVQYRVGRSGYRLDRPRLRLRWHYHQDDNLRSRLQHHIPGTGSSAKNDEGEGQWVMDSGTTEKAQLTVAFTSAIYTVGEGDVATTTMTVTPIADRNVTTTITMSGTGAYRSRVSPIGNTLTIERGQ